MDITNMATNKDSTRIGGVLKAACALGLFLSTNVAIAQNSQTGLSLPSRKLTAGVPTISYAGGQLRIDALDSTLADVLAKVAALTGADIDVPPGADRERMHIVDLGPGPARQVLAALLSDSNFDYLIQASDVDPEKIQNVLLMRRTKGGGGNYTIDAAARPSRAPYARAVTPAASQEPPAPDNTVPPPAENGAVEANSLNPTPQPEQTSSPVFAELDSKPVQVPVPQSAPLAPPQTLSPQSINQQLQQMYQQRAQMIQQGQAAPLAERQQ
jgi:hypothetical protein